MREWKLLTGCNRLNDTHSNNVHKVIIKILILLLIIIIIIKKYPFEFQANVLFIKPRL